MAENITREHVEFIARGLFIELFGENTGLDGGPDWAEGGMQWRRGPNATMPTTALSGEPLWDEDNEELWIGTGGGGLVQVTGAATSGLTSFNGRTTPAAVPAVNDYTWAQVNKAVSSIADITTKNHSDLSGSGTITHTQLDTLHGELSGHQLLTSGVHGVVGDVVGTTDTQTLTNKTIDGLTITPTEWSNANHTHEGVTTGGLIDHTALTFIGANTHAQIDTHIGLNNEHIDWTSTTASLVTSGNLSSTKVYADSVNLSPPTDGVGDNAEVVWRDFATDQIVFRLNYEESNPGKLRFHSLPLGSGTYNWTHLELDSSTNGIGVSASATVANGIHSGGNIESEADVKALGFISAQGGMKFGYQEDFLIEQPTPDTYYAGDVGDVLKRAAGGGIEWAEPFGGSSPSFETIDVTGTFADAIHVTTGGITIDSGASDVGITFEGGRSIIARGASAIKLTGLVEIADGIEIQSGPVTLPSAPKILLGSDAGTSGQVLTSGGPGVATSWQDQVDTTGISGPPTAFIGSLATYDNLGAPNLDYRGVISTPQTIESLGQIKGLTLVSGSSITGTTGDINTVNVDTELNVTGQFVLTGADNVGTITGERLTIGDDLRFEIDGNVGIVGDTLQVVSRGGTVVGMGWVPPTGGATSFGTIDVIDPDLDAIDITHGGLTFSNTPDEFFNFDNMGVTFEEDWAGTGVTSHTFKLEPTGSFSGVELASALKVVGTGNYFPQVEIGSTATSVEPVLSFKTTTEYAEVRLNADNRVEFDSSLELATGKRIYLDNNAGVGYENGGGQISFGAEKFWHDNYSAGPATVGIQTGFKASDSLLVSGAIEATSTIWLNSVGAQPRSSLFMGTAPFDDLTNIPEFYFDEAADQFKFNRDVLTNKLKALDIDITLDSPVICNETFTTDTVGETTADVGVTVDGLLIKDGEIPSIQERLDVDGEPTGFPNRTDSTIDTRDSGPSIRITPVGASFDVWVKGVKYTKTSLEVGVITDVDGLWYLYYDATGTLQTTQTFSTSLAADVALVAVAYWNSTSSMFIYIGDERHGLIMDGATHAYLHLTRHTAVESGFGLGDILAGQNGALDSHAQMSTANGVMWDEDIRLSITGSSSPASIPVWSLSGASAEWKRDTATAFPVKYVFGSMPTWNEFSGGSWGQTVMINNDYFLMHFFATNDDSQQYIAIQGQADYNTLGQAREGAINEISNLFLVGLPITEFALVGTVIFKAGSSMANTPKCSIQSTAEGDDYISWVGVPLSPSTGPSNHENLLNIGINTHAAIDTHLADTTTNPHDVTLTDVGGAASVHTHLPSEVGLTNVTNEKQVVDSPWYTKYGYIGATTSTFCLIMGIDGVIKNTTLGTFPISTAQQAALDLKADASALDLKLDILPSAGVARTRTFGPTEMYNSNVWTGTSNVSNMGATSCYTFSGPPLGTKWVAVTFLVPDNWKTGTDITIDLGFGVSSSTPAAANVNFTIIPVCHTHNAAGSESAYLGREYSNSRSTTITLTDVAAYSQTYVRKDGITISTAGALGSGSISPGDTLPIQVQMSVGTTNPVSSSTAHFSFIKVHYTATDYEEV